LSTSTFVFATASTTHLPTEKMIWNPAKDMPDLKGRVALVTGGKFASDLQLLFSY
jgi:NAD(P)-dependent dehydrogenase (short-subunit alcohol dehydrogenase family)